MMYVFVVLDDVCICCNTNGTILLLIDNYLLKVL